MDSTHRKRRRPYASAIREDRANLTRRRVLDAATRLFLERGFAATTVVAIATAAEVSPETIYATFDGKRGLLQGVIDAAVSGNSAIPLEMQSEWDDIAQRPTSRARLRAYVEFSCGVLARTSQIHHIIRGAADSEPIAIELSARQLRERLASNVKHLRDYVGADLRHGLTLRRAAEQYCALSSPELHHLLTVKLGWSQRAHRDWLATIAEQDLLGPA
jgi:AcrR family transcriptional regulator